MPVTTEPESQSVQVETVSGRAGSLTLLVLPISFILAAIAGFVAWPLLGTGARPPILVLAITFAYLVWMLFAHVFYSGANGSVRERNPKNMLRETLWNPFVSAGRTGPLVKKLHEMNEGQASQIIFATPAATPLVRKALCDEPMTEEEQFFTIHGRSFASICIALTICFDCVQVLIGRRASFEQDMLWMIAGVAVVIFLPRLVMWGLSALGLGASIASPGHVRWSGLVAVKVFESRGTVTAIYRTPFFGVSFVRFLTPRSSLAFFTPTTAVKRIVGAMVSPHVAPS